MNTTFRGAAKRRVVVTGLGAVTPLGASMAETWNGVAAGRSPAATIRRFDASGFPTRIAYEVRDFRLDSAGLRADELPYLSLVSSFGWQAANEALRHAGALTAPVATPERTAVCLGVGMESPDVEWYNEVYLPRRLSDDRMMPCVRVLPYILGDLLSRAAHARGGCTTVHTACASSGQALGEAYEMIAYDQADLVLTGGSDSMITPFYLSGFSLLGALSRRNDDPPTASRPFDVGRDGFVMGEGASMLVFEEREHAVGRHASILAEVCGYGITASAYRVTDLHPQGRGPKEAMEDALADAGITPAHIGYLNAHGTSTPLNDRIEAGAIRQVFPEGSCNLQVSSTKSMTGHMISAAGAIEFAITVEALRRQLLPPTINIFEHDQECPVTLTAPEATPTAIDYALSSSVGFGGSNTSLIAARANGE